MNSSQSILAFRPPVSRLPVRSLVLHTSHLGTCRELDRRIFAAFHHGTLTSSSMLAIGPEATSALTCWNELELRRRHGALAGDLLRRRLRDPALPFDLGGQLNLTAGQPLGDWFPAELRDEVGRFSNVLKLLSNRCGPLRRSLLLSVRCELRAQIEMLLELGAPLTFLSALDGIDRLPVVRAAMAELSAEYRLPVVPVPTSRFAGNPVVVQRQVQTALAQAGHREQVGGGFAAEQLRSLDWLTTPEAATELASAGYRLTRWTDRAAAVGRCRAAA